MKSGSQVHISCNNYFAPSTDKQIQCNFRDLPRAVRPNDILYIDDGAIVMLVTETDEVITSASL